MFTNVDSFSNIIELILFTKYTDAGSEILVDHWINLINTKQELFEHTIRNIDRSLLNFFIGYIEIFPQEDCIKILKLIKKNKSL